MSIFTDNCIVDQLERMRDWMFHKSRMQYFLIFWGEMLGQGLFAFMNINIINGIANKDTLPGMKVVYTSIFYTMSMFINISYGREFTGGVYNPAVVFFRMFRRTDRYKPAIGILYLGSEFLGSVLGNLVAFFVCDLQYTSIMQVLPVKIQMIQCFCEAMGTFILTFMAQYAIEKKMTFCGHNKELYIWLPFLYLIARGYSAKSNGVNPAFGLGYEFGWCLKFNRWDVFPMVYILIIPPFIGAGLAVFLFQLVLRPYFPMKQEQINLILEQLSKNQGDMRRATKITRQNTRINHRVNIGEAVTAQQTAYVLQLQDLYNFGLIQNLQDQQQIESIPSQEQQEQLMEFNQRIDKFIHRALQPSDASKNPSMLSSVR